MGTLNHQDMTLGDINKSNSQNTTLRSIKNRIIKAQNEGNIRKSNSQGATLRDINKSNS